MTDDRIQNIEMTLASQDQQIQDLSDMVNAQWKELERLKLHIRKAGDKIQNLEDSIDGPASADERPPHY
ncbi:MAG: SlyX family protein [Alphaproteobacteria bacterium]|nr:SlyX family protein [Alphaproteobacteria bacterium]